MEYKLICDYQENFESVSRDGHINDHQDQETFERILTAIRNTGYDCEIFEGVPALLSALNNKHSFSNTIFLNLSDGMSQQYSRTQIPILCELLNVPYSGGNAFAVALTSNKYYTKLAVEKLGVKTPKSILATKKNYPDPLTLKTIQYPVIVKPNAEGSSVGITDKSICTTDAELNTLLDRQLRFFNEVLIEEFISGYDITNFIVGNKNHYIINETLIALKNGAVVQDMEVMSYKDYIHRDNWYASPTGYISTECIERIKKESIAIAERLETYDIARLDYRVTKNNEIYFLEINTVPAIHQKSQAGAICELMGISFDDFVHAWVSSVTQRISETEPNLFS